MKLPGKIVFFDKVRQDNFEYWLALTFKHYTLKDFVKDHIKEYDPWLARELNLRIKTDKCGKEKVDVFFNKWPFYNLDRIEKCLFFSFESEWELELTLGVI